LRTRTGAPAVIAPTRSTIADLPPTDYREVGRSGTCPPV